MRNADLGADEMVKHAPSMEETLDSVTQGASLFLDPTGSEVGEKVVGEEGIAYADLDLNDCVEPKQFHDTVGYYQRFDIFDLKVNRKRHGPESSFQHDAERPRTEAADTVNERPHTNSEANLSRGSLKVL